jgi:predicted Zn-dependent peptidase
LEGSVVDLLRDVSTGGITPAELDRAHAVLLRLGLAELGSVTARADRLGQFATLFDDPNRLNIELAELLSVTSEDVANVARSVLDDAQRVRIVFEPDDVAAA